MKLINYSVPGQCKMTRNIITTNTNASKVSHAHPETEQQSWPQSISYLHSPNPNASKPANTSSDGRSTTIGATPPDVMNIRNITSNWSNTSPYEEPEQQSFGKYGDWERADGLPGGCISSDPSAWSTEKEAFVLPPNLSRAPVDAMTDQQLRQLGQSHESRPSHTIPPIRAPYSPYVPNRGFESGLHHASNPTVYSRPPHDTYISPRSGLLKPCLPDATHDNPFRLPEAEQHSAETPRAAPSYTFEGHREFEARLNAVARLEAARGAPEQASPEQPPTDAEAEADTEYSQQLVFGKFIHPTGPRQLVPDAEWRAAAEREPMLQAFIEAIDWADGGKQKWEAQAEQQEQEYRQQQEQRTRDGLGDLWGMAGESAVHGW